MFGGISAVRSTRAWVLGLVLIACLGMSTSALANTAFISSDTHRLVYQVDAASSDIVFSSYVSAGIRRYRFEDFDYPTTIGIFPNDEGLCTSTPGIVDCASLSSYRFELSAGADRLTADYVDPASRAISVDAGGGNDTIVGGSNGDGIDGGPGDDSIDGWSGNDFITGGPGDDQVFGFAGNDVFPMGTSADGNDQVFGGENQDVVDYSLRSRDLTVTVGRDNDSDGDRGVGEMDTIESDIEEVRSGSGNDSLTASPQGTHLIGNAGNDVLIGSSAPDNLEGGNDNDTIRALNGGVDQITCGNGDDHVFVDRADVITDPRACESIDYGVTVVVPIVPASGQSISPVTTPSVTPNSTSTGERVINNTTTTSQIIREVAPSAAQVTKGTSTLKIISAVRKGKTLLIKAAYQGAAGKLQAFYRRGKKISRKTEIVVAANSYKTLSFSVPIKAADLKALKSKKRKSVKFSALVAVKGTSQSATKTVSIKQKKR